LFTQGMVCMETQKCPEHGWLFPYEVEDGKCVNCGQEAETGRSEAMSKSRKNVVDPEEMLDRYGADTIRLFVLSDSPPERTVEWSESGVQGAHKFLHRVWRISHRLHDEIGDVALAPGTSFGPEAMELRRTVHKAVQKVSDDMTRRFHFNTAIAEIRVLFNALSSFAADTEDKKSAAAEALRMASLLLAPVTPHLAEELWSALGNEDMVSVQPWPSHDPALVVEETVELGVQVNGKLRARVRVPADADNKAIEEAALAEPGVQRHIEGKEIKKVIVVPGRLVNLVAK
jgi:leucyl-tRNA synthetase